MGSSKAAQNARIGWNRRLREKVKQRSEHVGIGSPLVVVLGERKHEGHVGGLRLIDGLHGDFADFRGDVVLGHARQLFVGHLLAPSFGQLFGVHR